jgi:choline dehydrogenase-like flavoprotein
MKTRRNFLNLLGRLGLTGAVAPSVTACADLLRAPTPAPGAHFDLVVIGSGFGGTLTALAVAYNMEERAGKSPAAPLRILMLERGTWWTTPTETIQDKQVKTRDFLIRKGQPTQEWSSLNDYRGMLDLVRRCRYSKRRPQGLYDFAPIGKHGLFNVRNDGVSVLRASGVGGGSLIYSKILIRPPETLFDDPRWPGAWRGSAGAPMRSKYYRDALKGVSHGVETLMPGKSALATGMTGPSNILTRSAGQPPAAFPPVSPAAVRALARADPKRPLLQIQIRPEANQLKGRETELIDRARIFQTAIAQLTPFYGAVDLSINDMAFTAGAPGGASSTSLKQPGINYCERHGRCNIGCLPGAGQTLNKQLMRAIYGVTATGTLDRRPAPDGQCLLKHVALQLAPLAEADHISVREDGSYLIQYRQRGIDDPAAPPHTVVVSAERVIVAAGSLGTSELMLRSRRRSVETDGAEGLGLLSAKLGYGFSPNGDHIAFLTGTKERVNLTYGPVTTSFGQFKPDAPRADGFHNIEDQGVPRSLAALTGHGVPVIQTMAHDDGVERYFDALGGALKAMHGIFTRAPDRTYGATGAADLSADRPESEDELTARVMCVVAQGKDDANGQFRLEDNRLRLQRTDGKTFHQDPIYTDIKLTLDRLAQRLRPENSSATFISPLSDARLPGRPPTVLTSHPLGGCPMGESAQTGVVDEWGRVYRQQPGPTALYRGLYIADGSVIPTALGVNPALTISAVALRVAERVLAEWDQIRDQIPAGGVRTATPLQCKV